MDFGQFLSSHFVHCYVSLLLSYIIVFYYSVCKATFMKDYSFLVSSSDVLWFLLFEHLFIFMHVFLLFYPGTPSKASIRYTFQVITALGDSISLSGNVSNEKKNTLIVKTNALANCFLMVSLLKGLQELSACVSIEVSLQVVKRH